MHRRLVDGIYIVQAKKDGATGYWAAATAHENAIIAVEKELGPGWMVAVTKRQPTSTRWSRLKMRPNTVRKL
jgi:hypothetical protein